MDIGEVAERSGMRVSTLRYYEEMRLIRSSGRRGLRRQFEADVLERLALISLGQSAGFTLGEIARVLTPPGRPAIDPARVNPAGSARRRRPAASRGYKSSS